MLSDSKIMTKTSVGRMIIVAIMRNGSTRKAYPRIYVRGDTNVRMTPSGRAA